MVLDELLHVLTMSKDCKYGLVWYQNNFTSCTFYICCQTSTMNLNLEIRNFKNGWGLFGHPGFELILCEVLNLPCLYLILFVHCGLQLWSATSFVRGYRLWFVTENEDLIKIWIWKWWNCLMIVILPFQVVYYSIVGFK